MTDEKEQENPTLKTYSFIKNKKLTPEQELEREQAILELRSQNKTFLEITQILHISHNYVGKIIKKHNLPNKLTPSLKVPKQIQEEIIKLYNSGKTIIELTELYNFQTRKMIKSILKNNNIDFHNQRKYRMNNNCLDNIDTEEKCYLLGMIWSAIAPDKGFELSFEMHGLKIMQQINKIFTEQNLIRFRRDKETGENIICRMSVIRNHINEKLIYHKENFLKTANIEQLRHFIRGYFDKHRCLSLQDNGFMKIDIYHPNSLEFIEFIKNTIKKIGVCSNIYPAWTGHIIRITKISRCYKFLNWLYQDCNIKLDYNYDRFKKHTQQELEEIYKKTRISQAKLKNETELGFRFRRVVSRYINKGLHDFNMQDEVFVQEMLKILGYDIDRLKQHLESLFEPWMNWENWGQYKPESWDDKDPSTWKWNLDHIVPHSEFKYSSIKDEEFKKCWDLNNLRPYSAKLNVIDGAKKIRHKNKERYGRDR